MQSAVGWARGCADALEAHGQRQGPTPPRTADDPPVRDRAIYDAIDRLVPAPVRREIEARRTE